MLVNRARVLHYRERMTYSDTILAALARSGRSGREVSFAAVGHESAIRSIKRGMDVRASTLAALCDELGLEFYVGPPRPREARGYDAAIREREPPPPWLTQLTNDLHTEIESLRDALVGIPTAFRDDRRAVDVAWLTEARDVPGVRCLACYDVHAGDGSAALLDDSTLVGFLAFHRSWLDRHRLDSAQCAIVRVRGESMAPSLNDGSTILVNLAQRRRRPGGVFLIRTADGLLVRQIRREDDGGWQIAGNDPTHAPRAWPAGARIVGQVRWGTRTF